MGNFSVWTEVTIALDQLISNLHKNSIGHWIRIMQLKPKEMSNIPMTQ